MRHQQMVESNKLHSKRMILVKKEQILQKDWMDAFDEWHQSIKCIEECFSILFPSVYSHPNNRSDDRSNERACILPAVKGSTTVKAAVEEEEEEEEDESLDDDAAMSPYHQDESGVEWVEGDDDDDDAHGDGHGDRDDDDNNQKTKNDKFNTNDDVDHHHLSTRQAYNLEEDKDEEDEEEFYDDESMPTGAVPYSLVSMLINS